jgi:hypothetical protein
MTNNYQQYMYMNNNKIKTIKKHHIYKYPSIRSIIQNKKNNDYENKRINRYYLNKNLSNEFMCSSTIDNCKQLIINAQINKLKGLLDTYKKYKDNEIKYRYTYKLIEYICRNNYPDILRLVLITYRLPITDDMDHTELIKYVCRNDLNISG